MKERHSADRLIRRYNELAATYDEVFKRQEWAGPQETAQGLARVFALAVRTPRILDLGTGTGLVAERLRVRYPGAHIAGIDFSEAMLRKCRQKKVADALVCADFQRGGLIFADGTFDLVSCCGVFEILSDPVPVVSEIGRVLSPSGAFAVTVLSDSTDDWALATDTKHTADLIEDAFTAAGLDAGNGERFSAYGTKEQSVHYRLYAGTKMQAPVAAP